MRSAQIDALYNDGGRPETGQLGMNPMASRNCRQAVEERARRDGYERVEVGEIRTDNRPGRGNRLMGNVHAFEQGQPEELHFSCAVDPRDGDVKGLDLVPLR